MASAFSHILVGFALGQAQPWKRWPGRFWGLSFVCSLLPDVDIVGFGMGIPYDHLLGHRGLTHSFAFAAGMGLLVVQLAFPSVSPGTWAWWSLVTHFFLVTASHGVLDALTDGGLGIAFYAPVDNSRYFFPWRPIKVSPIGVSEFFTARGIEVLVSELVWVGMPVGVGLMTIMIIRRQFTRKHL